MSYSTERDSLWQRVARVQARTTGRIVHFRFSGLALAGTRRKVVSYGKLKGQTGQGSARFTRVKRQVSKHKTRGAEVEKIYYYGLRDRLLLAEYYEQHQLVRLELHEYPLREGNEYGTVLRTTRWVSGDYLQVRVHAQGSRGTTQQYYYTAPRAPH